MERDDEGQGERGDFDRPETIREVFGLSASPPAQAAELVVADQSAGAVGR